MMNKTEILADLRKTYGDTVTRAQVLQYEKDHGLNEFSITRWYRTMSTKVSHGVYRLPDSDAPVTATTTAMPRNYTRKSQPRPVAPVVSQPLPPVAAIVSESSSDTLSFAVNKSTDTSTIADTIKRLAHEASLLSSVPAKSKAFVPFGEYDTIRTIIAAKVFCPFFITGHSGNGKTFGVEQACAAEGRENIRVNFTLETDEDDLIGGFRLKGGETVFELGPIPVAMIRGAVLTLDEIDLAGAKVMCLQPVLEGKPLLIKKLGVTIHPTPGFTVFATANTKGRGSEDGKYVGTNLLNEAFLERFNATIEQDYPGVAVEKKILAKTYESFGQSNTPETTVFWETLAKWADAIRATFNEGAIEDLITTRRLCHIVKLYSVFGDQQRALSLALNRFDKGVQEKFLDFYQKLDPSNADTTVSPNADTATVTTDAPAPPVNF